jgi:putative membrane protein
MQRTAIMAAAVSAVFAIAGTAYAADASAPNGTSAMPAPVNGVDTNAPLEGANSFTQDQVTKRLTDNGFTEITRLALDSKGIWRGKAKFQGNVLDVAVDYRGNIVYGGKIMAKAE